MKVTAVEGHPFLAPQQAGDDLQALLQTLETFPHRAQGETEHTVLAFLPARSHAQHQTPARKVVHVFRHARGVFAMRAVCTGCRKLMGVTRGPNSMRRVWVAA